MGRLAGDRRGRGRRRRRLAGVPGAGAPGAAERGGDRPGHRDDRPPRPAPGHRPEALRRRQPAGRRLPAQRRVPLGRLHRPGGAALPGRHHRGADLRAVGLDPVHAGRAWPSTPAPRTSGRCRPSGGRPTGSPPSPGRSAGCSAGSPPCSPRRSPACRRPPSRSWSPSPGSGAALLGGFQLVPADAGRWPDHRRRRGDGHPLRQRHQGLLPPGPDHRAQPHARLPRDLPRGRRARPRPAPPLPRGRATAAARHRPDQHPARSCWRPRSCSPCCSG